MTDNKKYPDNVVYNEETKKFDANIKHYPTTIGSQGFEILQIDKSDAIKADKYFNKRLEELKLEWEKLVDEYNSTKLIYETRYSFQPILGQIYHIYIDSRGENFLSIINPNEWNKQYLGSYILNTNGTWEKIEYGNT